LATLVARHLPPEHRFDVHCELCEQDPPLATFLGPQVKLLKQSVDMHCELSEHEPPLATFVARHVPPEHRFDVHCELSEQVPPLATFLGPQVKLLKHSVDAHCVLVVHAAPSASNCVAHTDDALQYPDTH
jgi:hypothetical protein